ncbi:TlpA disulfide reductase family protein [Gloeobacter morelensis]|uniref:TlpA family protein disulfide reductase n=1 Tax=Gloeobacter morelensis MG652769 TaxID=2781736 RepID=A0ABY3PI20_9CYAN|nr:TlpA disulfide reductase family protein [Gloeobacter morelensis]UFP93330.1 TlpA family protein disulfide reductase [Gloeobacter morelensis MG652769]
MALRMRAPLPSLAGVPTWINGGEPQPEDYQGKVVLVHFWSISCYICHDVVEQFNAIRDAYQPKGVVVLSVHQPRSEAELDAAAVTKDAVEAMLLTQPCAIDSEHTLVERFTNEYVPGYYVFDRKGEMRHFQTGGKGYERITKALDRCLAEG